MGLQQQQTRDAVQTIAHAPNLQSEEIVCEWITMLLLITREILPFRLHCQYYRSMTTIAWEARRDGSRRRHNPLREHAEVENALYRVEEVPVLGDVSNPTAMVGGGYYYQMQTSLRIFSFYPPKDAPAMQHKVDNENPHGMCARD
jgi:hypothetical protein